MSAAQAPASQQTPASQSAPQSAPQNAPSAPNNTEVDMMDHAPDSPPEHPHFPMQGPSTSQTPHQQAGRANASSNNETGKPVNHGAPGSSWQSKKFTDEYDAAWSRVIHSDYDPSKYGDPLIGRG